MSPPQDTVWVRQHEQTILARVEGWGRMTHGLPLRRFAEQALAAGATSLLMDLRDCDYMDSTFLGTLIFLKRTIDARGKGTCALVSPSPACRQLLQKMGLTAIFPVVSESELPAGDWTVLIAAPTDLEAFKCNVVQAHQELAALPGPAGEAFREVARCLTQDAAAKAPRASP